MQHTSELVRQIVHLTRNNGYLAPDHAMAVASNILEAHPLPDAIAVLAPALIRHAAIFDPFNREKLRLANDVNGRIPHDPFTLWLKTARQLTDRDPMPDIIPYPEAKTATPADYIDYMEAQPANDTRFPILLHLWQLRAHEAFIRAIQIIAESQSGFLAAPIMAWGAYTMGEKILAEMILDEGITNFQSETLRARMALDSNALETAREHLMASLALEPFQPSVIEQLAAITPKQSIVPGRDTHICLYTWNKPDMLAHTMASLATTDLGEARITILNNGTTTCSPADFEAIVIKAAPSLSINWVHLPVNIGAPAARNWLLSLPEIAHSTHVAFLDDDVKLPKHWLCRYLETLTRFPDATAVGPKCLNDKVQTIQYAFRFFDETGERKIRFTANAPTLMDMGQFDQTRPSLTVMGCCHLFHMTRMRALDIGGFDIRYSPSQVDDIDHDLQIWKAGGQIIYDGRVNVIHMQDTGKAQSRAALGQAYANHFKMENKFSKEELEQMDNASKQADARCFDQALTTVIPQLTGSARIFWQTIASLFPG